MYILTKNSKLHSPHETLEAARAEIKRVGGWNIWSIFWWDSENHCYREVVPVL